MENVVKHIAKIFSVKSVDKEISDVNDDTRPYRVVRKDGTKVFDFNNYNDALDFTNKLNQLYYENNFKDKARVELVESVNV